ncbi:MAG TPA: hypothetical protein VFV09_00315 [Actinomycetota bacterium]|nr:hypothetical protein [Actinomycetota bacterium]
MAEMTRRLQILVDEERWQRLEQQAKRRGSSVATLVREAIDLAFPSGEASAEDAAREFLARPPVDLGDWVASKREIEAGMERGLA